MRSNGQHCRRIDGEFQRAKPLLCYQPTTSSVMEASETIGVRNGESERPDERDQRPIPAKKCCIPPRLEWKHLTKEEYAWVLSRIRLVEGASSPLC